MTFKVAPDPSWPYDADVYLDAILNHLKSLVLFLSVVNFNESEVQCSNFRHINVEIFDLFDAF